MGNILYNLPMSEYLAATEIGSSSLKKILELTPADFFAALTQRSKETKSTKLGTATHAAILEPHTFDDLYLLQPRDWGPRSVGEGRKKWTALKEKALAENKTPLEWEHAEYLNRVRQAAAAHKPLQQLLDGGHAEVTAFAEIGELRCKARCDLLTSDKWIWDMKTSRKPMDDDSLPRVIFQNGYHFQAAHHTQTFRAAGLDIQGWGWIFVSTETPAVHILLRKASDRLLAAGLQDWHYAKELYEKCAADNCWPGYDAEPREISLPEYAERDYDDQ